MEDADARSRLLACATRLFGRKGFGATATRELVEAAGVSKPVLYYWFGSKEALFLEAVQAQLARLRAVVRDTIEGSGTLHERLERFVDGYVGAALADEDGVRLMMTAHHPLDDGQPRVDLLALHSETVTALALALDEARTRGELRADVDPAFAALSLLGTSNLVIVAAMRGAPLPERPAHHVVDGFLLGVAPR